MKKLSILLLSALCLTACSKNETPPQTTTEPKTASSLPANTQTAQAGEVKPVVSYVVATEASYPPFDFRDDKGEIIGFDVDILRAIAKNQGFSLSFIHVERSQLFDHLQENKSQILGACLGITFERLSRAEISTPYAFAPNVIMSSDTNVVGSLAELSGKKVAVQKGSFSAKLLQAIPNVQVEETKSLFEAYQAFALGTVDYVVGDAGSLEHFHKNNPIEGKNVKLTVYDKTEDTRVGFAVQKGNIELINQINTGLKNIQDDGTYDKIYAKWFGDDVTMRIPKEFEGKPVGK